jgi:hypothetical protein
MDLDSIEAGQPFAQVIRDALNSCAALVALIGRQWMMLADEEGQRRLDNPDDFVRLEVQTALERGVRVIPVLVDGASPPRQQQLPSGLQELAELNALELSYGRYDYDAGRLFERVQRVLAEAAADAKRQAREDAELSALEERARSSGESGDAAGARDQYAALLPMRERVSGQDHLNTLHARHALAWYTGRAGDAAGARVLYTALLSDYVRVLGPGHPTPCAPGMASPSSPGRRGTWWGRQASSPRCSRSTSGSSAQSTPIPWTPGMHSPGIPGWRVCG